MRVIVTAGGTGGHIYPALAIINKIKKEEENSEFLYIGTHNRMEKDIVKELGLKYEEIEVYGLKRKITLDNVKTISCMLKARKKCKKIIEEFNPDVVVGCGGYVTTPVIWAAKKLGKKTFIHEQNSTVGLSNKYLSRYADKIGVSFENTISEFDKDKVVLTGNPCGENAISAKKMDITTLGLDKNKKTVLIVMGSLGSGSINDKIIDMIDSFRNKEYQVIFITGKDYYEKIKNRRVPENVKMLPFVNGLPSLMKSVDLMVSRAGASTISEINAIGIPTIFIPSPYVTNNHQYKNAMALVEKNAGLILKEEEVNKGSLIGMIDKTLSNKDKCEKIKENALNMGINNSSSLIYDALKEMIMDDKRFF